MRIVCWPNAVFQNVAVFGDRTFQEEIELNRSLGGTLIQYDWSSYEKEFGTDTHKGKIRGKYSHIPAKDRGLKKSILSIS